MQYISMKRTLIEVNSYTTSYSIAFDAFSDSSDRSCGVYPRVAFMTVLVVYCEAII